MSKCRQKSASNMFELGTTPPPLGKCPNPSRKKFPFSYLASLCSWDSYLLLILCKKEEEGNSHRAKVSLKSIEKKNIKWDYSTFNNNNNDLLTLYYSRQAFPTLFYSKKYLSPKCNFCSQTQTVYFEKKKKKIQFEIFTVITCTYTNQICELNTPWLRL